MTVLNDCETILERHDEDNGQTAELKRKASDRIAVLSKYAKGACEAAVQGAEGDPVRAFTLVNQVNALVEGIDSIHRLLRQVVPETDGVVKQMTEVKKGAFRNLAFDVQTNVDYSLPIKWAVVPALRTVVQVLKDLDEISQC